MFSAEFVSAAVAEEDVEASSDQLESWWFWACFNPTVGWICNAVLHEYHWCIFGKFVIVNLVDCQHVFIFSDNCVFFEFETVWNGSFFDVEVMVYDWVYVGAAVYEHQFLGSIIDTMQGLSNKLPNTLTPWQILIQLNNIRRRLNL